VTLDALAVGNRVAVTPAADPAATVPGDARQLPARAGALPDDPQADAVATNIAPVAIAVTARRATA